MKQGIKFLIRSEIGYGFQEACRTPRLNFSRSTPRDCLNSASTAKYRDVTAHANPTFAWTDLATERERQLTTGKRAERTKRDFRCQFPALLFHLRAPSSTDVPVLLLRYVMLHETIGNDEFQRNTGLQRCFDIVSNCYNIVPTMQRCVALKIVVANRLA